MKKLAILIVLFSSLFLACTPDPVPGDTTGGGGGGGVNHYPVFSGFHFVDKQDGYNQVDSVKVDLDFRSDDPIREINFYYRWLNKKEFAGTSPYIANYKADTESDELIINFRVPSVVNTTMVTIEAEIINETGLSANTSSDAVIFSLVFRVYP